MIPCPCGSRLTYDSCCGLYIDNGQLAPSPEQLMRSRYTAYSMANIDYIKKTMFGKPLIGFDIENSKRWAKRVSWTGLRVIKACLKNPELGEVEFIANFIDKNKCHTIHEISEFQCKNGAWFYTDGELQPATVKSISQQESCPCGREKKFKNCHGLK